MRTPKAPHTSDLFADRPQQPSPKPAAVSSAGIARRSDAAPATARALLPLTLPSERFLTDRDVAARYDVSRATVWRWTKVYPEFPKPHPVTPGTTRWRLSELLTYDDAMAQRIAGRGK